MRKMLLELAILFQQAVRMILSKKKQQIYTTALPIIYCHEMQFMCPLFSFLFFFFEKFIYAWKWMDNLQQNEHHQISCHLFSIFNLTSRRFVVLKIYNFTNSFQYHYSKFTQHALLHACFPTFLASHSYFELDTTPPALLVFSWLGN